MQKTYAGSCHCGAVRFEADIDLTAASYRCNCSICSRTRFWPAVIKPEAFRLFSGQSALTKYLFNSMRNEHYFCKHCGVRAFGIGNSPESGGKVYGINLGCLEDVTAQQLAAIPIIYVDGKHDKWNLPPAITSHL